jgi:hypothetical protein
MINTVPKNVTLSAPIGPRQWILIESHLDISATGAVLYSGTAATYSWGPVPNQATYVYNTNTGGNTGGLQTQPWSKYLRSLNIGTMAKYLLTAKPIDTFPLNGDGIFTTRPFGIIYNYAFNNTLTSTAITSIEVQNTYTESINLNLFIIPSKSFESQSSPGNYVIRAAVSLNDSPGIQITN